jgi:hypothetical protein
MGKLYRQPKLFKSPVRSMSFADDIDNGGVGPINPSYNNGGMVGPPEPYNNRPIDNSGPVVSPNPWNNPGQATYNQPGGVPDTPGGIYKTTGATVPGAPVVLNAPGGFFGAAARLGTPDLDPTDIPADYARLYTTEDVMRKRQKLLEQQQMAAGGRVAPGMGPMENVSRRAVQNVNAQQVKEQVAMPSYDVARANLASANQAMAQQQAAIDLQAQAAAGLAPSQAENLLSNAMAQNARQAMGLAQARGFSPSAIRGAQYQAAQAGQESAGSLAALRAQEMAAARDAYATSTQGLRASAIEQQRIEQETNLQAAQLKQNAEMYKTTTEGNRALANADMVLKARLANQNIDLDILKFNAQRGDQYALANLEAKLKQTGMNDAMVLAYMENIVGIDTSIMAAELARMKIEADRQTASAQMRSQWTGTILGTIGDLVGLGGMKGATTDVGAGYSDYTKMAGGTPSGSIIRAPIPATTATTATGPGAGAAPTTATTPAPTAQPPSDMIEVSPGNWVPRSAVDGLSLKGFRQAEPAGTYPGATARGNLFSPAMRKLTWS